MLFLLKALMPAKVVAPGGARGVGLNPLCGGACFRIDFAASGGGAAVGYSRNKETARSNTIAHAASAGAFPLSLFAKYLQLLNNQF